MGIIYPTRIRQLRGAPGWERANGQPHHSLLCYWCVRGGGFWALKVTRSGFIDTYQAMTNSDRYNDSQVIETTDVMFAVDSIPAVLSITSDSFIAYTYV